MADLPSGPIVKINDLETGQDSPVTQALMVKIGQDINGLIDRTFFFQEFTSSGNFTVPVGIERLWVYACGGGGGGSSGFLYTGAPAAAENGAGGAGANPTWHLIDVVPEVTYAVTIGAGGAGGSNSGSFQNGSNGGTTSFGSLFYARGGEGGQWVPGVDYDAATAVLRYRGRPGLNAGSCTPSRGGQGAVYWTSGSVAATAGIGGVVGSGGGGGSGNYAGGGGGGSIGIGGTGAGGSGTGNSPVATSGGIGAGGGGGASAINNQSIYDRAGASGGPGYMMVVWF